MTSSFTPLGFDQQGPGDNPNAWGDVLNESVIALVDEAIRGMASFTLSGTVVLTSTNGESNQARCAILNITAGTGGTVIVPDQTKIYLVFNQASGNAVISASGGTDATIEAGDALLVFCDGTNVRQLLIAGLPLRDYIGAAVLAATGSLPALTGNAGKFLFTDGSSSYWKFAQTTDLGDYETAVKGLQIALAVAL